LTEVKVGDGLDAILQDSGAVIRLGGFYLCVKQAQVPGGDAQQGGKKGEHEEQWDSSTQKSGVGRRR
jgi:hypothetical protein